MHSITSGMLGLVAAGVRGTKDVRHRITPTGNRHDTDADAEPEAPRSPREMELGDRLAQRFRNSGRVVGGAIFQEYREFVAAQAGKRIAFAQLAREQSADLAQYLIPSSVPARIVDFLEMVEIKIENRVFPIKFSRARKRTI
jgi:hypothetical protein